MAIKSKARHDLTLRSIKRELAAGRDVAFWLDKAYTHYDNGLMDEADIAEVEALAQAYYDALDADGNADAADAAGGWLRKVPRRQKRTLLTQRETRRRREVCPHPPLRRHLPPRGKAWRVTTR